MAEIHSMATAPQDRTIIVQYYPSHFHSWEVGYVNTSYPKWEEVRWISDKEQTGSEPHWEPWCGELTVRSTNHISPGQCLGWVEVPSGR